MKNDKYKKLIPLAIAAVLILIAYFLIFSPDSDPFKDDIELISEASAMHIEWVSNGLDSGFRIENVHAVQFTENNQWMVGGLLSGSILSNVFACWLVDEETEMVYAVDYIAEEYSSFTFANEAGYEVGSPNRECGILANYLE